MSPSSPHRLRVAALAVAGVLASSAGLPASAHTATSGIRDAQRRAHHGVLLHSSAVTAAAAADLTPAQVLAQVNMARARYGVPPLAMDTSVSTGLANHAHYVQLNALTDGDLSTEETDQRGYTASGAAIAPYAAVQDAPTWRAALDGWLSDPYYRDVELLDPTATSIGFGTQGAVRAIAVTYTGQPPTGYPRSYPAGAGTATLANGATWLASDYGCPGKGFPITAMWDWTTYGRAVATSGTLRADDTTVATCAIDPTVLATGQAALVPKDALTPGTHYSGTITATMSLLAGGSANVSTPVDFTTAAPATGVAGDQSGDRVADVFVVDAAGNLWLYKGSRTGVLGHGWKVAQGWQAYNWLSQTGDVNGDGRTDLLARRQDGRMFLFTSNGMGSFAPAKEVGHGWAGLTALTVVGDLNHDGTRDLVARTASGDLLRYDLGSTITGGTRIGVNWGRMDHLVGPGSMNGDRYDDILAVRSDGNLYVYYGGRNGSIVGSRQVGRGWNGWDALFVPGDFNADGRLDLVGRKPTGELFSYLNLGAAWGPATRAGAGFAGARLFG